MQQTTHNTVLQVRCADRPGLIHTITHFALQHGANIVSNQEFVEPIDRVFFLRAEMEGVADPAEMLRGLKGALPSDSEIYLEPLRKQRAVVLASKEHHCLGDVLLRTRYGEWGMEIVSVVSNHSLLQGLTEDFHLPFSCISHEGVDRKTHEENLHSHIQDLNPDLIVLAKYMRILSPEFVAHYENRIVNIHHSFLPAFVGAKPYRQAYDRGVKIIGATAHFVTAQLDEGPIITQDVIRVNHSYSPEKLALWGKDLETVVLSKAIRYVLEKRVMVYKNRTVVFE